MDIKMNYKIIFSAAVLLFFKLNFAQTVTVLEQGSNEPIPGVAIYNLKKTKYVVSDIDGQAQLDEFNPREIIYFQNILYQKKQLRKFDLSEVNNIIYLTPKVELLNQIVISASKFQQSKRDIPQTIVSFNAEEIAAANPQTSADLLENTGNVFIQKSQLGGGSPMIRGFSTNRLLISVDGVRMNNAIFRGGNLQNVISIDPFSVSRTEVTEHNLPSANI